MKKFYNSQYLHIPLFFFPLSFILGIVVAEIFALIFLIFLVFNFNQRKSFFEKEIIILTLFSMYIAFNAMFQITDDLKYSSFFHLRYLFFSLAIFLLFEKSLNENLNKKIVHIFLIALSILLFDSFFQFIFGLNILGNEIIAQRISSFFGDELILGSYLIRLLPILIWYIYYFKINLNEKKLLYTSFFAAYFSVIYLSGERTSIALFLIFFFLTIIFIKELRKLFIRSFVIFLVFAISIIFFDYGKSSVTNRVFKRTYQQIFQAEKKDTVNKVITDTSKNSKIKIFSTDHQGHLILAKKLFLDNLVFGTGPKGFRHYCRKINYNSEIGICSTHPHNILAQVSSELGIIGIIFFSVFFIFLLKRFIEITFVKTKNNHHYAFLVASLGIFINLFPFLPSGNLFNNWISLIIYFNLGLYLVSNKKIKSK
tara:strand:+ start:672 stop:1949 length:1278 start_codon:yes stop_codon:yes gene_type:complete